MTKNRVLVKQAILAVFSALLMGFAAHAADDAPKAQDGPAVPTQELFKKQRLPKIVVANDGSVLAFAAGCRFLRRSEDQGKTWSDVQKLEANGGNAIVDETNGDILVVCPAKSFLLRSKDNGKTWAKETIKFKPNLGGHGTPEHLPIDVACSESGITLKYGKHKGRLVMPGRISPPNNNNDQEIWQYHYNTSMISDDGGKTWQAGEPIMTGTGEGTLAELSDGRVYYNSRMHLAVDHRRRIAFSHDGGYRWVDWQVSNDLYEVGGPFYFKYGGKPSYGCNAGLVRVPDEATDLKDVHLFSAPDNPGGTEPFSGRVKMTIWMSTDGAKSWPKKRLIYEGPSAYSSLACDKKGNVYLLFESGKKKLYEGISVVRLNLKQLGLEE